MIYDRQQTKAFHEKEDILAQLSKDTHPFSFTNFARSMSSLISRNHRGVGAFIDVIVLKPNASLNRRKDNNSKGLKRCHTKSMDDDIKKNYKPWYHKTDRRTLAASLLP